MYDVPGRAWRLSLPQGRDVPGRGEKGGVRMHQDFDHLLADHLLARERATRRREEAEREPAARLAWAARSSGDGLAGGGKVARGGALLRAWFR